MHSGTNEVLFLTHEGDFSVRTGDHNSMIFVRFVKERKGSWSPKETPPRTELGQNQRKVYFPMKVRILRVNWTIRIATTAGTRDRELSAIPIGTWGLDCQTIRQKL